MRVDVVTLFPEMVKTLLRFGVTGRAVERGLLRVDAWDPRDDAHDRHRTVDDRPYGGGPGMVMKVQPLRDTLQRARAAAQAPGKTVYLSPQGRPLTQDGARELARGTRLILLAGRYEGIDERLIATEVDEEWSIGDYVLSGGELAALVLIDAVARLLPGALNDARVGRARTRSCRRTAGLPALHPARRDRGAAGAGGAAERRSCRHRPLAAA